MVERQERAALVVAAQLEAHERAVLAAVGPVELEQALGLELEDAATMRASQRPIDSGSVSAAQTSDGVAS